MRISTRGRYGLRLLLDLAASGTSDHIALSIVAERQKISPRYLEQVATLLKRAGYIRSVKGSSGGYMLSRPASEVTVGEVLRVLEGDMLIVDPPQPGEAETPFQRCIRLIVYNRLNERIAAVVDHTTLASLIGSGESTNYSI